MGSRKSKSLLCVIIACGLLASSCSNLTQENYDKIRVGMSYAETVTLLGKDHRCDSALGLKNCAWGGEDKYVRIQFLGDKVVLFTGKGLN